MSDVTDRTYLAAETIKLISSDEFNASRPSESEYLSSVEINGIVSELSVFRFLQQSFLKQLKKRRLKQVVVKYSYHDRYHKIC